jgi:hypothetical protein
MTAMLQKVAEDNLATSVSAFNLTYKDTGLFGVVASAEPTKAQALSYNILYEIVRLAHKPTEEEVARAQHQVKTALLAQLDGSAAISNDIGRQVPYPLASGHSMTCVTGFCLHAHFDDMAIDVVELAGPCLWPSSDHRRGLCSHRRREYLRRQGYDP